MRLSTRRRVLPAALLLLLSVSLVALGGAASGSTASKALIKIHESGTIDHAVQEGIKGKFTIELKLSPFGPAGTTAISPVPGPTKQVNGEEQIVFTATDNLTSKTGTLELAIKGIHIDVNVKGTPSGTVVGPAAEYGTWKIRSATGIYEGWKGGGNWASAATSYKRLQPYSVEWDGYITTP